MTTQTPQPRPPELLTQLTTARVIDRGQAALALAQARAAGAADNEATLADFLVRRGLITRHQADRALAGDVGRLSAGPYLLLEPLGAGSLGTVYRAVRRTDRKPHAVKVLPPRPTWNVLLARSLVGSFAGLSSHPAVVPCADIGSADGIYYLAWPFVEGESFEKFVQRDGPVDPVRAAELASEVADALAFCHRNGVSHGLVKPSNLLIDSGGKARILELGVGIVLAENITDPAALVDARTSGGWVDCTAPEVLTDPTRLAPAGDAYGLGCVLYYLLSGSYPFPDGTAADRMAAHRTREPVPVRTRRPQVPFGLGELVARLMRKDPADRPADLAAVRDALLKAVRDPAPGVITPPAKSEVTTAVPPPASRVPATPTPAPGPRLRPAAPLAPLPALPATPLVDLPAPKEEEEVPLRQVPEPPATASRPSLWRRFTRKMFSSEPEPMHLSVFGPTGLTHGESTRFGVFAHLPESFNKVNAVAREYLEGAELLTATAVPIPRGGEVWLHLAVTGAGAVVPHPLAKFPWGEESHHCPFFIHVPSWSKEPGPAEATLTIGLNGYEVSVLRFQLAALSPAKPEDD
jgi:serine/threonine protein kinase